MASGSIDGVMSLRRGDVVADRYVIDHALGRGSTGEVYAAIDREGQRPVALKIPAPRAQQPASLVQRLIRGARSVACIEHPHLVRVYDCAIDEHGVPFLVMERPEGETLAQLLRTHQRLELGLALELARQLSSAIAALHAQHVVHRDIKPANLLVRSADATHHPDVKVLDFGLARLFEQDSSITRVGELLGTLMYMAPERLCGASTRSPEADVYAIGCVLFEMLSGRAPFTARTRTELQLAIRVDRTPDIREHRGDVVQDLALLISRSLAKSPEERPSAAALESSLGLLTDMQVRPSLPAGMRRRDFASDRFRIEQRIGAGAHGEVYSAFDTHRQQRVAIKRVHALSPHSLWRLKREFRSISSIDHPNLVRCYELWTEADDAFITMELIDGRDFLEHIGASRQTLMTTVQQVCAGLSTLHAAGLVHRDLKPAHVLVDGGGTAKLIDFSVIAVTGSNDTPAGTRPYFAPEATSSPASPAADMYALGVMIREATARIADERDWPDLFARLLAPAPSDRPSAADICALLGVGEPSAQTSTSGAVTFVGRKRELAQLHDAVATNSSLPTVAIVSGPSGIGKSALLHHFTTTLPANSAVFHGICRPTEIVPFSAIDAAIDAISEHLRAQPDGAFKGLSLDGVACMLNVFPSLRRVEFLQRTAEGQWSPPDPVEAQSLAYEALRQLLKLLGANAHTVIVLDDLHWIDERTSSLLCHVLRSPDGPSIALVGTRLPEADVPAPALGRLLENLEDRVLELTLGPLAEVDSVELLHQVDSRSRGPSDLALEFHRQARGHPLLLLILAGRAAATQRHNETGLQAALLAQVNELPDANRRLLCAMCVCQTPLPLSVLCAATASEPHAFQLLMTQRLARRGTLGTDHVVEPYHAIVREVVVGSIAETSRRELHRRIAASLRIDVHARAMIEHLARSGAQRAAARLAEQLANEAERELSFEKAAALYGVALAHTDDVLSRGALFCRQADAYHRAGYTADAAGRLAEAAKLVDPRNAPALELRAGNLLLLSGDIDPGLRLLGATLHDHGIALATGLPQVLHQTIEAFVALQQRGLAYRTSTLAELPAEKVEYVDLCLSLAQGLSHVDLRGLPFAFRALHSALDIGEPTRIQRACAIFIWNTASHFPTDLVEPVLQLCLALTETIGSPHALALWHIARAEHLHFNADFLAAEFECERAEQLLLEHCSGIARELAGVRGGATFIQYSQKGDFRSRVPQTLRWMADAQRRGDRYHFNMLRAAHALVWIARDDPQKARAELTAAEADWPGGVSVFEVSIVLYLDVVDRYEGAKLAHLSPGQGRSSVLDSPAAQTPFLKGYLSLHRAWGALRAIARGESAHDESRMLDEALDTLKGLALPIWNHVAAAMEANLRFLHGDRRRSLELLQASELGFRGLHMLCLAACVRMRRGELTGGVLGRRLEHEAEAQLRDLGVARPEKWCRAYFSMFDSTLVDARTIGEDRP